MATEKSPEASRPGLGLTFWENGIGWTQADAIRGTLWQVLGRTVNTAREFPDRPWTQIADDILNAELKWLKDRQLQRPPNPHE